MGAFFLKFAKLGFSLTTSTPTLQIYSHICSSHPFPFALAMTIRIWLHFSASFSPRELSHPLTFYFFSPHLPRPSISDLKTLGPTGLEILGNSGLFVFHPAPTSWVFRFFSMVPLLSGGSCFSVVGWFWFWGTVWHWRHWGMLVVLRCGWMV